MLQGHSLAGRLQGRVASSGPTVIGQTPSFPQSCWRRPQGHLQGCFEAISAFFWPFSVDFCGSLNDTVSQTTWNQPTSISWFLLMWSRLLFSTGFTGFKGSPFSEAQGLVGNSVYLVRDMEASQSPLELVRWWLLPRFCGHQRSQVTTQRGHHPLGALGTRPLISLKMFSVLPTWALAAQQPSKKRPNLLGLKLSCFLYTCSFYPLRFLPGASRSLPSRPHILPNSPGRLRTEFLEHLHHFQQSDASSSSPTSNLIFQWCQAQLLPDLCSARAGLRSWLWPFPLPLASPPL